jgi:hypothetical protein
VAYKKKRIGRAALGPFTMVIGYLLFVTHKMMNGVSIWLLATGTWLLAESN